MPYAFFDLDQTLLPYDTQTLFANFVLRRYPLRRAYLALVGPVAPLKVLRIVGNRGLKRCFLSYLAGMPWTQVDALAEEFAATVVPPVLYPEVMAEVALHRDAGRTLILNTASPDIYAGAIARQLGFHECIATKVERAGEKVPLLPRIAVNNKEDAKLKAMRHLMPAELSLPLPATWAYSDSKADLPLLRFAEIPIVINPDSFLHAVAQEEGWKILTPPRPNPGKKFVTDCLLQALGLWTAPGTK